MDTQALLRARLVDIFMGDWDRHRKQWRWARLPGSPLWAPIPEDRDQAFSRYEGVRARHGREARTRASRTSRPKYPKIGGLTYNGSEQDRRLLVGFSREDFVRTAKALQAQLTDAAIEKAVRRMPPEWFAIDGARLDRGPQGAARRPGRHRGEVPPRTWRREVDVYMTNQSERVEAKRLGNGDMDVTVRIAGPDGAPGTPSFHRVFDGNETEEVRFYALDGNDTIVVTGGRKGPRVRMVGGNGQRHARRHRRRQREAVGLGGPEPRGRREGGRRGRTRRRRRRRTRPGSRRATGRARRWGMPWVSYGGDLGVFLGYGIQHPALRLPQDPLCDRPPGPGRLVLRAGERPRRLRRASSSARTAARSSASTPTPRASRCCASTASATRPPATAATRTSTRSTRTSSCSTPPSSVPFGSKGLLTLGPAAKYTQSDEGKDQFINDAKPYGVGDFGELARPRRPLLGRPGQRRVPAQGRLRGGARHLLPADVGRDRATSAR